ncbi:MAG: NAD(P)-binding domain-containing protein [Ignavibacteriales bacterium]|nr:NAD(P)-binding domain-containing protein [Ignavibacteriales bacterium]
MQLRTSKKIIDQFSHDEDFKKIRSSKNSDVKDFIIIGAGPAGIAAGIEALKHNFSFTILESSKKFEHNRKLSKGQTNFCRAI